MISILIPARNEKYLQRTIDGLFENARGDIEVLVALDNWPSAPQMKVKRGRVIHTRAGQRRATTLLAQFALGEIVMKTDAHCLFAPGYDIALAKDLQPKTILAPYMLVLDEEMWMPINKRASQYCFDTNFIMQYDVERPEILSETMCLQGSCFVMSRNDFFEFGLNDDKLDSWGGQGPELGIKAFLNGGKCMTTKNTYYAHLFRTTAEAFPYERGEDPGGLATDQLIWRYRNKKLLPLIEKFGYPADWSVDNVHSLLA
jgi:glycosyltransferase involved in cell wall biosynthesis